MKILVSMTCIAVGILSGFAAWGQTTVQIGSTTGGDIRVAVAVPDFLAQPGLENMAKEMTEVLKNDLVFTGIFTIVPREKYPPSFKGLTPNATDIDFDAWRQAKVEYMVYANVTAEGDKLVAECRMFDVNNGTQIAGQRLTSTRNYPRLIAHRFEEEVVRKVDGTPGMASSVICFSSGRTGSKEIFIADYDGANARQVTKFGSVTILPKFSPKGDKIAFVSYKDKFPFLYVFDIASGATTVVSKRVGLNVAPAWSPDGRRLAMTLSKDANAEIYIKSSDPGTPEQRVTNNPASDAQPTFDPTGTRLAFVSDRGGIQQIYTMGVDGSNVNRVTYSGGKACDPSWSPDGKRIAYVSEKSGEGMEVYMADLTDNSFTRLTDSGGMNESPSWSPDSRHIIFSSSRSGKPELYAVNVRPPYDEHKISVNGMACEGPYWGPRR